MINNRKDEKIKIRKEILIGEINGDAITIIMLESVKEKLLDYIKLVNYISL